MLYEIINHCQGAEIGRQASLRTAWSNDRAGSTPAPGTRDYYQYK